MTWRITFTSIRQYTLISLRFKEMSTTILTTSTTTSYASMPVVTGNLGTAAPAHYPPTLTLKSKNSKNKLVFYSQNLSSLSLSLQYTNKVTGTSMLPHAGDSS